MTVKCSCVAFSFEQENASLRTKAMLAFGKLAPLSKIAGDESVKQSFVNSVVPLLIYLNDDNNDVVRVCSILLHMLIVNSASWTFLLVCYVTRAFIGLEDRVAERECDDRRAAARTVLESAARGRKSALRRIHKLVHQTSGKRRARRRSCVTNVI